MTGQLAVKLLRSQLQWTQRDLSRETLISERTIRRIEKGLVTPIPQAQHKLIALVAQRIPHALPPDVRRHVINPDRMRHYLNGPCTGWQHWTRKQRGQFRRWRLYYRRILADASAGRCVIIQQYRDRTRTPRALLARSSSSL